ncbi:uncharacterized protein LOC133902093 isoform X3 [Phragmites australis]|uniref:uncharacterized protein LOC133902093 isoform X3 n=1 Tax=Phragmites australis TaxID=29695 RepID=UPI002D7A355A|nr:uncharacterized protein LOC133902093 isoform X3 [Phragmites australis]
MAGLSTGAPIVQVYHEKSIILPDVSRVLACLYEKDIKFKTHTASYKSLLRLQALSHAPVPFYDGPKFLEESREICRYIAEKYEHQGYPFLLGKDALERASVEQWLHNEEHAFNPPSRALFCHLAFPLDEEDDGNDIDIHTRKLEEVLEVYEQRLSDSEFLAGNKFTLADLVHLPNSHYITASDKFLYLYDSRKNVRRWWDAISTRDSWKQVLRDMKTVEEQHKQELKKQQQQKEHPTTSGHPIRIDPLKKTSTEPWTILVPPADTVSSSPTVPQIEKPLATDIFPDGALASSSQSTPIAHETSVAQSKETTFFTTPQEKPTIAQKPPIVDVAKSITKEASSPEPTETDLPTRHKPSSVKDVAPSTQLISSTEPRNGIAIVAAPSRAKDSQTTPGRQDILSAPVGLVPPFSDTQHPSGEVQEYVPADDSGKAKPSKPSSAIREESPPTVVPASAPDTQHGTEPDDVALDEQKFSPSGQDSTHPIQTASSAKPRNEEIRDSAPSTQLISSIERSNGDATVATSDQAKDLQTTPGRQDILSAPIRSVSQRPSGEVQEDVLADDSGKAKPSKPSSAVRADTPPTMVPASAPDTQHGTEPDDVALGEQKISPSGAHPIKMASSAKPRNEEIRDSVRSTQLISSIEQRNGDEVATSDQAKDSQTTPGRQDIDTQHPSGKVQVDVPADDSGETKASKPPSTVREDSPTTVVPASAPDTQKLAPSGQESAHTSEPPSSTEPRKEETNAATADQTNVPETIFDHQVTRLTPDAREALRKDQESSHDDYHGSTLANPLIVNQEQAHTHAGRASEPREEPTPDVHSAGVDRKTTLPPSQAQTSNTGPDSTPISGDVAATSSIQNQEAQPPVATQVPTIQAPQGLASTQNIPYDSLGKIEPPIPPSTDQVMAPIKSPAAPSDDPQGTEPDRNSVRPQQEASFELPSGEETAMSQGDQVNTLPNGNLSDNQVVGQFERERSKGMNSQKNLEGTSADEKSKTQLQTDSSNTQSSKDNNNEVNGTTGSNISATFGELQKQPSRPMESIESSKEPEHQQQADQAIVQSLQGNNKQVEETKAQDTGTDKPEEMEPPENTNQKNNRISQAEALDHSGKQASGVQQLDENTKNASNPTEDTPGGLQNLNKSKDNLRYSEESKLQVQTEGKIQGGETEAPISETEQLKERGLPANSYRNNSSQSQAEASDKSIEQSSPGIQNKNKNSSRSDGSTNDTESGNMED